MAAKPQTGLLIVRANARPARGESDQRKRVEAGDHRSPPLGGPIRGGVGDPYGERSRVIGKGSEITRRWSERALRIVQGNGGDGDGSGPKLASARLRSCTGGFAPSPLADMTTRRARRGTPYPKLMAVESGIDLKGPDDGVWAANGPSRLVRSRPTGSWARHDQPPDSLPAPGTTSRSWQEPGRWCRGGSRLVWSAAAWRCLSYPGVEAFPGCRS